MRLVKHAQQPPIRVIEKLAETVNCDERPICVAVFSFFERWSALFLQFYICLYLLSSKYIFAS